jgi:dinuclear metal center YbgI/SA1388 family protein
MRVAELASAMEQIAPTRMAESWDNVGLLVGDPEQPVTSVMLTIDYTIEVAREAEAAGCDGIIAYHPPLFSPLKRLTGPNLVFDAIRRGVAIYSPHTALDVADGGTNDMLADALGLADRKPLRLTEPKTSQYKLVTFVPEKDLARVSDALFNAGAGRIGDYSRCSFQLKGAGTFLGEVGANPAIGMSGQMEKVEEIRLETVMPISQLPEILAALKANHPYEEPAFDLVQLAPPPDKLGQGRIGKFPSPVKRSDLISRVKNEMNLSHLLIAGPTDGDATSAACCAGSCGDLLDDALRQGAGFYLTGEMRHHDALRAAQFGMTVACTLHSNSERAVLKRLQSRLESALPGLKVLLSSRDRDPFAVR